MPRSSRPISKCHSLGDPAYKACDAGLGDSVTKWLTSTALLSSINLRQPRGMFLILKPPKEYGTINAMDPISIAAAVVGLLTAAVKVSTSLTTILHYSSNVSELAQNVLLEVSDISACLTQLHAFLAGTRVATRSRATLILVDQVVILLTSSTKTFSDLEEIIESLEPDKPMGLVSKVRWFKKESAISRLLLRLQASKSSLNLMLTALTW